MTPAHSLRCLAVLGAAFTFLTAPARSQTTLDYANPVLDSGTALSIGAVYRFSSVTTGADALVTITGLSNGASITSLANFDATASGYTHHWQPVITGDPDNNPYASFSIQFVNTGTSAATTLSDVNWSIIDIDGDNVGAREYAAVSGFTTYTLDAVTNLNVTDLGAGLWQFGPSAVTTYPGIDVTATQAAVTLHYNTVSAFNVVMGFTGTGSAQGRQFSEGTEPVSFSSPVATVPEPSGALLLAVVGVLVLLRRRNPRLAA